MEQVFEVMKSLDIEFDTVYHEAVFGKADHHKVENVDFKGEICKNLFLKDKKNNKFYLVCLPVAARADLKKVENGLKSDRLSFGNDKELMEKLNITPGSVSVLNVIGAPDTDITFVLDKEFKNIEKVSFHPNDNTCSVAFKPIEIEKILNKYNKAFMYLEVEA